MTLAIQAQELHKHFELAHGQPPKAAVDGISLSLVEGERVGFIGRNGAGKTTLLQMLAGIVQPTSGELRVNGHVTAIFTLGMGLREDLTGRENIFVEGELIGRPREQTAALMNEIVEFAELGAFIDRPVRTYSTGMKARLAFSTIVHIDPEILIVDEALSVGDTRFSAKAGARMRELAAKGRILIVVSHSMGAIEDLCNRCVWIDAGRVRMDGLPADVTRAYLDEVRSADQVGLAGRFRRELVNESIADGWRIDALEVLGPEGIPTGNVLTGDPCSLMARVTGPATRPFHACLRLSRLDGLLVLQSSSADAAQSWETQTGSGRELHVGFGRLPLNHGAYKAELEVVHGGEVVARRSILFEVVNPRPPRGGNPVLVHPSSLTSTLLSR